jgi:NDP-sugar pyrophosphorylase family protein
MKINLIIPMAGSGKRFINAGYADYKPFIKINNKYMIDYVLDQFGFDVQVHIITSENLVSKEQIEYLTKKNCNLIFIDSHINGPAYSIYQARNKLPLEESFFISYVDIYWNWDWDKVVGQLNHEGIVFTHSGFHPHLIDNNYSAFCESSVSDNDFLKEIKEKSSFTNNWMEEDLSIGVFYIRTGSLMIEAIDDLIANDIRVSNEFFPSLIFNYLVKLSNKIKLSKVDSFIHWGIPDQLNDFLHWGAVVNDKNIGKDSTSSCSVMTMAGLGNRMKEIHDLPKALIPVDSKPMYEFVLSRFNSISNSILTVDDVYSEITLEKSYNYINIGKQTSSQYETIKESVEILKDKKRFFLLSCDAYGLFSMEDFDHFLLENDPDIVIFGFKHSLTQEKSVKHHSHFSYIENNVTNIHIKSRNSCKDLGLAGFFWVKDGSTLCLEHTLESSKGIELVADDVFKELLKKDLKIMKYELNFYVHIGTPNEYLEFKYWTDRARFFDT